jgi:hypothetical protein
MYHRHSKIVLAVGLFAASTAVHAAAFSTSVGSPTPVPSSGVIEGKYPGQSNASFYFAVDLKAGDLASQISMNGGAQYKTLDFALLDGNGRKLDAYYITAGANDNGEATRVFPIDASGKYIVRLDTKGPETTSFRVALGGTALPDLHTAPAQPNGPSQSFLGPTAVPATGVVTGSFPGGNANAYYYFSADLKAGELLTQTSIAGRQGPIKWISLTLLNDDGRPDKSYFMSRVEANADATKSFPIDRSGHYIFRLAVQGPETTKYKIEFGGDAFAPGK